MGCCMGVLRWLFNTPLNICCVIPFFFLLFFFLRACPFLNIIMLPPFRSSCLVIWHSEYSGKDRYSIPQHNYITLHSYTFFKSVHYLGRTTLYLALTNHHGRYPIHVSFRPNNLPL